MPIIKCNFCHESFARKPSQILLAEKHYCSNECRYKAKRRGMTVKCNICGVDTYKIRKALKSSKSGKFFCSKSCQAKWRNGYFAGSKHANWIHGKSAYRSILDRNKIPKICTLCKTEDSRVLATHHIDRNRFNNELENLAWLCHNCHFLVHHDNVERQRFTDIRAQR